MRREVMTLSHAEEDLTARMLGAAVDTFLAADDVRLTHPRS
jgi:hypothetical protein